MKIIAFSVDNELFKNECLLHEFWMSRFPGALWIPLLANKLELRGYSVTSVDVALHRVKIGFWRADDIGIIQHIDNSDSDELILLGAHPLIITAMESPVYATHFFQNISSIATKFPKKVFWQALYNHLLPDPANNYTLRFPAYLNTDITEITPFHKRKFMTMVVRNMYNESLSPILFKHPIDTIKWFYRFIRYFSIDNILNKNKFKFSSLHDKRLEAIIFFGRQNSLDLFGNGWDNIKNLPRYYRTKMKPLLKKMKPKRVENKISTISKYKFVLCFENASFQGGVSEKIIDCFVAGSIPVYLGASNIQEFVPKEAFIDVRLFNSWEELYQNLKGITEEEANSIIEKGRNFLYSDEGQMHSYDGFAAFMEDLVLQECN